jgi:type II secretory pathway pseudopilin PulG
MVLIPSLTTLGGSPQQVVTFTNTIPFTTVFTTTSYAPQSTVGTSYITSVQQQYAYSGQFTLIAVPPRYGCEVKTLPIDGNHGDHIIGTVTSDNPVGVYLMIDSFYRAWNIGNQCTAIGTAQDVLISREGITSLSIDITINFSAKYYFIFFNYDNQKAATVNFNVAASSNRVTVTSFQGYIYSGGGGTSIETVTSTGSSLAVQTGEGFAMGGNLLLIVVAIVVILGLVGIILYRKRSGQVREDIRQPTEKSSAQSEPIKQKSGMFCLKCGAKISRDSKFCKECGNKF